MTDPFATEEHKNNRFRNNRGAYLTTSLFIDHQYDYNLAMYTWKDHDFKKGEIEFPSLKRLYLAMEDVTEYEFACTYLDGWRHWKTLLDSPVVRKHIDEWREELELKLRSRGLKKLIQMAEDEEKPSYQASKYLADKEWIPKDSRKRANAKDTKQRSTLKTAYKSDLERVSKIR